MSLPDRASPHSESNPWKTVRSREVYGNAWLTVHEDVVIRPDGAEGIYGRVDMKTATGVVALTPGNEVYLVGQYRYPIDAYSWEIVEGGNDPGEDPLTTARRELQEEAGIIAAEWIPLGDTLHLSNSVTNEEGYLYLARGLTHTQTSHEATEVLQIKTVPFAECLAMVDSGEITDAMSVMGLLLADRYLRS